jgi:hypothetical protein
MESRDEGIALRMGKGGFPFLRIQIWLEIILLD